MIVEIKNSKEKQAISRKVLEALTDWFGIEESREEYISGSADWTFFAAKEDDEAVGFLCLTDNSKNTPILLGGGMNCYLFFIHIYLTPF